MEQMTLPLTVAKNPAAAPGAPSKKPHLKGAPGPWWAAALRVLLPALATGGLLWLCFFPMAWGWLAWVAVVPLLALVRSQARPSAIYLCSIVGGLGFYLAVLRWMPVADDRMYATWAALSLYCSLYFPVILFLVRWLERRTPLPLLVTVPVVWTGLEFVRSFLLTGFAWYFLGHTQHQFLAIIQVCDLGGVYVVSFLVALVNSLVFEALFAQGWFRRLLGQREPDRVAVALGWPAWQRLALQGGIVSVLFAATLVYGQVRLAEERDFLPGPRVALIQGDIDQRLRNTDPEKADEQAKNAFKQIQYQYGVLHQLALFSQPHPDLIVWPETSCPESWLATDPAIPTSEIPPLWAKWQTETQDEFRKFMESRRTNVLLGLNAEVLMDPTKRPVRYNSALLFYGTGATGPRYDKIHRVPFGEYVPFRETLPFMDAFSPYDFDYSVRAGEKLTRFELGQYTFGVLICYEDSDPFLARQYGAQHPDGKAVDFLVNMSNDGWFDGSEEHEEHLALCRFRAIETRRAVARSVNMGISAVIDSNGRVLKPRDWKTQDRKTGEVIGLWPVVEEYGSTPEMPVAEWAAKKKVAGVLMANIPIDRRVSLYAHWGDWLPLSCWGLLGLVLVGSVGSRVYRRTT